MGKFKDWLTEEDQATHKVGTDNNVVHPSSANNSDMSVANQLSSNKKALQKAHQASAFAAGGNKTAVRKMTGEITNDLRNDNKRVPTSFSGVTRNLDIPGVDVKKMYSGDPRMRKTYMKKEAHVIETPKMAWKSQKASMTPNTVLPQKGDRISHNIGQRKRCSPVKPAKGTNVMGIKLPKTEKHAYKNPFA
jgi:hypothetical protein